MELPEVEMETRGAKRPAEQEITREEGIEPIALKEQKTEEVETAEQKAARIQTAKEILAAKASWPALPLELREIIPNNLLTARGATPHIRLINAAQNIRNLFMINKEYKENYLDNVKLAGDIIMGLAKEFSEQKKQKTVTEKDVIEAALAFATDAASKWIGIYIHEPVASEPMTPEQREQLEKFKKIKAVSTDILTNAAKEGDASTIRFLLAYAKEFVNVRRDDAMGNTLLMFAIAADNEPLAAELLKLGANPNLASRAGYTALWFAAGSGNLALFNRLLAAGANPAVPVGGGNMTLLMNAKSADIAKRLIELGIPVNAVSASQNTALNYAVLSNHSDVVAALLTAGANPNISDVFGLSPLHNAVKVDNVEIIIQLLQKGANKEVFDTANLTPLALAVQKEKIDAVKTLLEAGANQNVGIIDLQGRTLPLFLWSLVQENFPIADLLVTHGANVNMLVGPDITLLKSLRNTPPSPSHERIIKFLIDHGAHE